MAKRAKDSDAIRRQWEMLRMIPRHPRKIDTATVETLLKELDFDVNRRTIQRDLSALSVPFPLMSDDRSKPFGWSWKPDAQALEIPGMSTQTALTFRLVEQFLTMILPKSTLRHLGPHFKRAREVLEQLEPKRLKTWPNKVRILPQGLTLLPPNVPQGVENEVYQALLEEKKLSVQYQGRWDKRPKTMELNPLALVFRDQVAYLVCTIWQYQDVRQLPIHRMKQAQVLSETATTPKGFVLNDYLSGGVFRDGRQAERIKLRIRLYSNAGRHLLEAPLSNDQKAKVVDDETLEIRATVIYNLELVWWLRTFGPYVEVLSPKKVREDTVHVAKKVLELYGA